MVGAGILALLVMASCGPIPVDQAEAQCLEPARMATGPHGSVAFGADSSGHTGMSVSIGVSSDFLQGNDPSDVFNRCVVQKSGQYPTRPLQQQPGWVN